MITSGKIEQTVYCQQKLSKRYPTQRWLLKNPVILSFYASKSRLLAFHNLQTDITPNTAVLQTRCKSLLHTSVPFIDPFLISMIR